MVPCRQRAESHGGAKEERASIKINISIFICERYNKDYNSTKKRLQKVRCFVTDTKNGHFSASLFGLTCPD